MPSAGGVMSRVACAKLKQAGIGLAPLLRKAGLTVQQIDDRRAWLGAQNQIKFLDLAADAWEIGFSASISRGISIFARSGCCTMS
jgi:hypothetical protein